LVTLPPEFVAIDEYPGYFWNIDEQRLYSIKIGGVLKRLRWQRPNHYNKLREKFPDVNVQYGYQLSHEGKRFWVHDQYLKNLEYKDSVIPVKDKS